MTVPEVSAGAAREALRGSPGARGTDRDDDAVRDRYARGLWSALTEPGDGVAGALRDRWGAVGALAIALSPDGGEERAAEAGIARDALQKARDRWRPRAGDLGEAFDAARRAGAALLTPADPQWPAGLDDLGPHAPVGLWTLGAPDRPLTPGSAVALVGARAATAYGEHVAMELAAELAATGTTVVSGAAYGVDGCAHRAALRVEGMTLALLAGGVDRPYPAGHSEMLDRIARTGVVASEVPCGSTPTKWRFLARNRLIAAAADATVVVEAGWRSGSLNTAHHAAALGRPLGAVPGPITSAASAGCHRLLREADALCITNADDVRELLGLPVTAATDGGGRTDERTRVLDALSVRAPRAGEEVARRAGLSAGDAAALLGLLELEGRAARGIDGWRRC